MPNATKEEPSWRPNPALMNKSWVELAAEEDDDFYNEALEAAAEAAVEAAVQAAPEPVKPPVEPEDKCRALKRIDFASAAASGERDVSPPRPVQESPMKVESPLLPCLDEESPMKTGTPIKSDTETTPSKTSSPRKEGSSAKSSVSKRLWASPRRRDPLNALSPRVSPRRPTLPPMAPSDLMSPPRDACLKRKRAQDLFKQARATVHQYSVLAPRDVPQLRWKQMLRHKRSHRHPHTPPRELKHSRRAWDGMVRAWRQQLHNWDPPGHSEALDALDCSLDTDDMSEVSGGSAACPSDAGSEISYPGSGSKLRPAQRPSSTLSLDDFPPLV
ncbi:hypothetical protein B566_EDAN002113 [Ephemera danica]|nr:hypothetical protein B566_EDAN002113 [Ephemera danica]